MKQVNSTQSFVKQKWFLTASLLAVLAGNSALQSSFLSSSLNSGTFEMSSEAKPVVVKPSDKTRQPEYVNPFLKNDPKKTQAQSVESGACTSGDCKTTAAPSVLLKLEDYNNLIARIAELEKQTADAKAAEVKPVVAKPTETTTTEPEKTETRSEKRDRLAQEKKDKELEKQDERVAKFEDKMENIKDKCDKDLSCLTSEFTSALDKFDGKNSIPAGVVNKYFKSMVSAPLSRSLYTDGPDSQASLEVLQSIMSDVPAQYRGIKEITMDAIRYQATVPANHINQGYKSADDLSKQNNPQAYFQQINTTRDEQQTLTTQATSYTAVIEQSLRETGDTSSLSYYQRSYLPNMQKIMSSLTSPTSEVNTTTPTQNNNVNTTRDSRNGQTAPVQNQQPNPQFNNQFNNGPQDNSKMTNPQTRGGAPQGVSSQTAWTLSTPDNSFQQGQPSTTTRGGRGHN